MEGDADFNTELVQQNQEQEYQQTMEDQQLPPSVSETNLEDPGAGHIVSGDLEPVREDDIHENDMVKKGESDDEVGDFGAVNLKGESRDTTHFGDGDLEDGDLEDGDLGDGDLGGDLGERENGDFDDNLYNIRTEKGQSGDVTRKKKIRKSQKEGSAPALEAENPIAEYGADYNGDYNGDYNAEYGEFVNEDPAQRKRRLLEEKMDMVVKNRTTKRRRADEDDLERMQDDKIDFLKNKMIEAANLDVEKNSQGLIATEKLKLLREVMDTLSKADLAISILDNNLLEAVRLWLEPLPDSSMPAYQIQKELLQSLVDLPIKTDHLVASGIGKVLVFYQRSKRTEPILKKLVDKLIGEWTRPILNKSDSYKDRTIHFNDYNKSKFTNKLASKKNKTQEQKTLYEQQAERRKRAAIPSARTTAYKIAPKVDPSLLMRQQKGTGEMFNRINRKMTNSRKKVVKKSGPSVEGKHLSM